MSPNTLDLNLPFLDASELLGLASNLDAIYSRTLKAIERLNKDVAARKSEIANRWKTAHLDPMQKRTIEAQEIMVAIRTIRQNAEKELDALLKDAGAAHSRAVAQRGFYDSPVKTLNRITLGDPKRSEYARQLETVGTAELAHLGQFAVSTGNKSLAAAIVSRLDTVPTGSRPFGSVALANAMRVDEHVKGSEAIKIADQRLQGILVAIRAWQSERSNPLNTVSLALRERNLDDNVLREMEASDAAS